MLALLVFLPLALALTLGSRALEEPDARSRARARLEEVRGGAPFQARLAAARGAAEVLGRESRLARRLRAAATAAESHAEGRRDAAALFLELELDAVRRDLAFVRVDEAPLPLGFPEPTPVGELRVQRYPAHRLARVPMEGGEDGRAFWRLLRHIQRRDVSMTAPVETTLAEDGRGGRAMAFLYGRPAQGAAGEDGPVEVVDAAPLAAVSLGCRGPEVPEQVARGVEELERWLAARGDAWERAGPPRVLGYNSPFVPAARRYWEVQIPVRAVE